MAQLTDVQLTAEASVIKNETIANANTADRVGTMLYDLIDSKFNLENLSTDPLLGSSNTDISSQGAVKTYVDAKIDTNTSLGSSDVVAPSQKATKTYVDAKIDTNTSLGSSNTVAPSQNAVKTYVDTNISNLNLSKYITTGSSSSNQSITGSLRVNGDTTVTGSLKVLGNPTIIGNTKITGDITNVGNTVITGSESITGNLNVGSVVSTGIGATTGDTSLELGTYRTGDGNCFIDLHSTSGSDYDARIIRNSGTNGELSIQNIGTGNLRLQTNSPGFVYSQGWFGVNRNATVNTGFFNPDSLTANRTYTLPNRDGSMMLTSGLHIVDYGTVNVGSLGSYNAQISLNITLPNTNYQVMVTPWINALTAGSGKNTAHIVYNKTTTSFGLSMDCYSGTATNVKADWIIFTA